MDKRYIVIGSWIDKASGTPVSRIAKISAGVNKGGHPYEIVDTEVWEMVEGTYPVGTILTATMTFTAPEHQEDQRRLKLGTSK